MTSISASPVPASRLADGAPLSQSVLVKAPEFADQVRSLLSKGDLSLANSEKAATFETSGKNFNFAAAFDKTSGPPGPTTAVPSPTMAAAAKSVAWHAGETPAPVVTTQRKAIESRAMAILADPKADTAALRDAVKALQAINPGHKLTPDQQKAYYQAAMRNNDRVIADMPAADLPQTAKQCAAATFGGDPATSAERKKRALAAVEARAMAILNDPAPPIGALSRAVEALKAINPDHKLTPSQQAAYDQATLRNNDRIIASLPAADLPRAAKRCASPTFGNEHVQPAEHRQKALAAVEKRAMAILNDPAPAAGDLRHAVDALKAINPDHKLTPAQQAAYDQAAIRSNDRIIAKLPASDLPRAAKQCVDPIFGKGHAQPAEHRQKALAAVEARALDILADPKADTAAIRDAVKALQAINPGHKLTPDQQKAYYQAAMRNNDRVIADMPAADLPQTAKQCAAATFGGDPATSAERKKRALAAVEARAMAILNDPAPPIGALSRAVEALKAINPDHKLTPSQQAAYDQATLRNNDRIIASLPAADLPRAAKRCASPTFGNEHVQPAEHRQKALAAVEKRAMAILNDPAPAAGDLRHAVEALKAINPDHKLTPAQQAAYDQAAIRSNDRIIAKLPAAKLPTAAKQCADPIFGKDHAQPAEHRQKALAAVEARAKEILADPKSSAADQAAARQAMEILRPKAH